MSDKFLSLGTVVVFSIILPGVILVGILTFLDPDLKSASIAYLTGAVVTIGFCSNVLGHFFGIVARSPFAEFRAIPFQKIYLASYEMEKTKAEMLRKDGEFWFSIYCLYWNVAWGLPIVWLLSDCMHSVTVWVGGIALFVTLLYLSVKVLGGILDLSSVANREQASIQSDLHVSENESARRMREKDINKVVTIVVAEENSDNIWYSEEVDDIKTIVAGWLKDPKLVVLVSVSLKKEVTGVVKLRRWHHSKKKHIAWIGPLAVSPSVYRKGYGRRLLSQALRVCTDSGIRRVELNAPVDATAMVQLLKSTGFVAEGTMRQALRRDSGEYVDVVQYSKILDVSNAEHNIAADVLPV